MNQVIGYAATGLANTSHTIKIVVDNAHDSQSSNYYVSIDAFVVGSVTQVDDGSSSVHAHSGSGWTNDVNGGDTSRRLHPHRAYDANSGDSASYTFTGTGIEWISNLYQNHGYANVSIDGTTVLSNADTYTAAANNKLFDYPAFGVSNLAYGTHTIKISVAGSHDSQANGTYIVIDEFIATNAQGSSSTTPVTSWPSGWTIKTYDSCSTPVARILPSNPVATTVSSQTVFPVAAPYGSSLQVCIANSATNTNTGALPSGIDAALEHGSERLNDPERHAADLERFGHRQQRGVRQQRGLSMTLANACATSADTR